MSVITRIEAAGGAVKHRRRLMVAAGGAAVGGPLTNARKSEGNDSIRKLIHFCDAMNLVHCADLIGGMGCGKDWKVAVGLRLLPLS